MTNYHSICIFSGSIYAVTLLATLFFYMLYELSWQDLNLLDIYWKYLLFLQIIALFFIDKFLYLN